MSMDRSDYIALVEQSYFGNMTLGRPADILALFKPEAAITVFYGGAPVRVMRADPQDGEESLEKFFSQAVDTFDVRYTDFEHVVDVQAQRIWSMYTLHIGPKAGGPPTDVPFGRLRNCNFFEIEDGKISAVTVYFANPPTLPQR